MKTSLNVTIVECVPFTNYNSTKLLTNKSTIPKIRGKLYVYNRIKVLCSEYFNNKRLVYPVCKSPYNMLPL